MKRIAIIGGGIIGLSSAFYLSRAGHEITVFDAEDFKNSCSIGNAGMIVPSHHIPLASPGMIAKGIRWMFNAKSPFYVKPRFSKDLVRWGMKFYAHANQAHVERSIPALKEISMLSKSLYRVLANENIFDFGYDERGLLMLYHARETEKEEAEAARVANENGVEAQILSLPEIQRLEPEVKVSARGGVYFPGDAHLVPQNLISNLIKYLKQQGVAFFTNAEVDNLFVVGDRVISVELKRERHQFDEFIIAAGAWSGILCSKVRIDIPMQSGKGYSFTLPDVSRNIRIPSLLLEGRVAATPMGNSLRFGGTMEINGTDRSVNMKRVTGIVETIPKYYPEMSIRMPDPNCVWSGLRPCSPDGLPYIGRSSKYKNIIIATGHSMMGVSLGLATGKLVTEIVDEVKTSMDISMFNPDRFARR